MISFLVCDKFGDLVDSLVIYSVGEWNGLKVDKIISEICKFFKIIVMIEIDVGFLIFYFRFD